MTSGYVAPRYGNWRKPSTSGIGKLNFITALGMFVGLAVTVLLMMLTRFEVAMGSATVFAAAIGATMFKDSHGRGLGERVATRVGWWRTRRAGAHLYRSGPLGRADFGRFRAPGLLAPSRLLEGRDAFGEPFALLAVPATGHYTLVFACDPPDTYAIDDPVVDQWVANYGGWLASVAEVHDVKAASVTVETCPSTGTEFRASLDKRRTPGSPEHTRRVVDELRANGSGGSVIHGWATITFGAHGAGGGRRNDTQMLREIAVQVPGLAADLAATGAGAVGAATAYDVCEMVRTAYDPAVGPLFEQARASGERVEITWDEVGPSASQATWDSYRHDSGVSVTWAMSGAPRGHVLSGVLRRLLEPIAGIERKRVTLLYQPLAPQEAVAAVESDERNAHNRASGQSSQRAKQEAAAATRSAVEEAQGAGVTDFGMLVTATVRPDQNPAWARTAIRNAAGGCRTRLRVVHGSQDSAFAASLPLGLVLPEHVTTPRLVREAVR